MSSLTQAEWECLADVVGSQDPEEVYARVETSGEHEVAMFIGCLGGEALLTIFQTDLLLATGPLSLETSACIRGNLGGIPTQGYSFDDPVALVTTQTAGSAVILSCLNEEEWQSGPMSMGLGEYNPGGFDCLIRRLGGPQGFGEAYAALQFGMGNRTALSEAEASCGVVYEGYGGAMPGSVGTDAPVEQEFPSESDALVFYDGLTPSERACMDSVDLGVGAIEAMLGDGEPLEEVDALAAASCLYDVSATILFLMSLTGLPTGEVAIFAECFTQEIPSERIRKVLAPPDGMRNPAEGLRLGLEAEAAFSACMAANN